MQNREKKKAPTDKRRSQNGCCYSGKWAPKSSGMPGSHHQADSCAHWWYAKIMWTVYSWIVLNEILFANVIIVAVDATCFLFVMSLCSIFIFLFIWYACWFASVIFVSAISFVIVCTVFFCFLCGWFVCFTQNCYRSVAHLKQMNKKNYYMPFITNYSLIVEQLLANTHQ